MFSLKYPIYSEKKVQHAGKENSASPVSQVSKPSPKCSCDLTADDQISKPQSKKASAGSTKVVTWHS
jgi:hypothetical protein